MTSRDIPDRPDPHPRAGRATPSIRALIVLIAMIAASLAAYRRWQDYRTIESRVHPALDLIPVPSVGRLQPIIDEITATIQPETWEANGGPRQIQAMNLSGSIYARNNRSAQRAIADLLEKKRAEKKRLR